MNRNVWSLNYGEFSAVFTTQKLAHTYLIKKVESIGGRVGSVKEDGDYIQYKIIYSPIVSETVELRQVTINPE